MDDIQLETRTCFIAISTGIGSSLLSVLNVWRFVSPNGEMSGLYRIEAL